jgi:SWI/SNF-related matrix-associated actin-dependent regulator of chromatin subfamily A-like protein 1
VPNWRSEVVKFLGEEHAHKFTVSSYDSLAKVDGGFDYIIADEIHAAKSLEAARTKRLHILVKATKPSHFLGLSATPILNGVQEFYSPLRLCWYGGKYPEFDRYSSSSWLFCKDFCNEKRLKFGGRKFTKWEGVKDPEGLRDLIKPVYLRKRLEDVDLQLPDIKRQEILVSEKSQVDKHLLSAFEAYTGNKSSGSFSSGKAISALSKVEFTCSLVREILTSDGPVVVFSDHVQAAEHLAEILGATHRVGLVTGSTGIAERSEIVKNVNACKLDAVIATIGSLSTGVNITGANYVVFNDFPWVPAVMEQAEGRIHRVGQVRTCHFFYVLASRIDEYVLKTLNTKKKIISQVGT